MVATRLNGHYNEGYFRSLHDFFSKKTFQKSQKKVKRIRRFNTQLTKLKNDVNYCIIKNLRKKKTYPIISDKFEISAKTADYLTNCYEVKGRLKCCSFFDDYKPISRVFFNESNFSKVDSLKAKILKKGSLKFFDENKVLSLTKKKFFFCIEFKKLEYVVK